MSRIVEPIPAFPVPIESKANGMTLHEWYAGLAMQALVSEGALSGAGHYPKGFTPDEVANKAFELATAMMGVPRPTY